MDIFESIYLLMKNKKYDDVVELLLKNGGKDINSPYDTDLNHAWYLLGDIFYKQEKYEQAISFFKKSLVDRVDDIDAILALANCYFELGLPKKAELILRDGKKLDPHNPKITYNLGNSLFDQRKFKKAIKLYEEIKFEDKEIFLLAEKNILMAKKSMAVSKQ